MTFKWEGFWGGGHFQVGTALNLSSHSALSFIGKIPTHAPTKPQSQPACKPRRRSGHASSKSRKHCDRSQPLRSEWVTGPDKKRVTSRDVYYRPVSFDESQRDWIWIFLLLRKYHGVLKPVNHCIFLDVNIEATSRRWHAGACCFLCKFLNLLHAAWSSRCLIKPVHLV